MEKRERRQAYNRSQEDEDQDLRDFGERLPNVLLLLHMNHT